MSQSFPILWIKVDDHTTADMIIKQSAKVCNPDGRAIMYPPKKLFLSIKSIENNCKAAKITNEDLCYQVRLGHNNLELWIKNIGDPDYIQVEPPSKSQRKIIHLLQSKPLSQVITKPRVNLKTKTSMNQHHKLQPKFKKRVPSFSHL